MGMRYLGIDYGRARIGLALSDTEGCIAFPQGTLRVVAGKGGELGALKDIVRVIKKEKVGAIVIGLPLTHDGGETEESECVRTFTKLLGEKIAVPIVFENEMFSSRMAEDGAGDKSTLDASVAAIILQSYLDKHKKHRT